MCTIPVARRFCYESYTGAEAVYERLKRLGMDLVTVTDHDSIDAAESLRSHPDFFLSEEVTCRTPGGVEAHIGVYGITDRDHIEMQRRRNDPDAFGAYITENGVLASINHPFSGLTGARSLRDFDWFADVLPAFETRNGAMLEMANRHAGALCSWLGKAPVGGSDAHILTMPAPPGRRSEAHGPLPSIYKAYGRAGVSCAAHRVDTASSPEPYFKSVAN
jgi:predicted metal-dependent phosphoesterase TrpH